jgi:uncharacterized protein with GYD domain
MPAYVLLSKLSTDGMRQILAEPDKLRGVRRILEEYEANILELARPGHLLGERICT